MIYKCIVSPDEKNSWYIKCTQLEGCHSLAQTLGQAIANIKQAIACCENIPDNKINDIEVSISYK